MVRATDPPPRFGLTIIFCVVWALLIEQYKKLSYRWQTARCRFVKLLKYCSTFLSEYVDKKFTRDYNVILYLSIFNSFWVIRCLSQCVSPKIAILPDFGFPRGRPGAITLNVVWMEREFDAYKLSRCICPSNYNSFWDTARYWSKIVNFFIPPLHSTPPLGGFPLE